MINMNKEKWNDYKIFCFVRNPYDRLISGWNYLNSKHGINSSFDEFINNKERVSDFEYIHTFMSQYNNMINENNIFCIDLLGKFENIENDFKNILLNIGFKEEEIIHDLTKKNNFEHKHFTDIINNQNLLDLVNKLCYEDFDKFHYKKYDDFNIFLLEYSNKNKIVVKNEVLPTIFIKKYLQLKGQLNNYNLIDNNFYDTSIIYESLNIFIENFELIKKEFLHNINFMQDWLLKDNNHVFFNKHTILPIYGYNNWSKYANSFPIIIGLIKKMEDFGNNVITCCFLKLSKNARLDQHYGYSPSSNYILRNHLGIIVPDNCGMWVNDEIKFHKEKEWITFDDSKLHTAFNNSNQERYILLIDLARPDYIKTGNSLRKDNFDNLINDFIIENIIN